MPPEESKLPKLDKSRKNLVVPLSIILSLASLVGAWLLNDYAAMRARVPQLVAQTQAVASVSDERYVEVRDRLADLRSGQEQAKNELKNQIAELNTRLENITNILMQRRVAAAPLELRMTP